MVKVAVDAMGGDFAPQEPVLGSVAAIKEQSDIELTLVGKQDEIEKVLPEDYKSYESRIDIVNADEVISANDNPTKAIKSKPESSMVKAMSLIKDNKVEAMVSAGNTGAFMAGGMLKVGRLGSIKRPALAPVFPTFDGKGTLVLDVGATMDAKPEHLRDFAIMGSVYASRVMGRKSPKVALINVGEEPGKGNQLVKDTYELLDKTELNFVGNVEARDMLSGEFDVVVCDGFMGNILLKFMEGMGKGMFSTMKEEFTSDITGKLGGYLLKPKFKSLKERFDYNSYSGAPFLGVDGILIKSHGSSNREAIKNAITKQVYHFVKKQVLTAFSDEIEKGVEDYG